LHDVRLLSEDEAWDWPVAPLGEESADYARIHRVMAYADYKSAVDARS
jgi:hypothetical protein